MKLLITPLGVISGGLITGVPFGTVVQATIFIMTILAIYDYLSPGATGVIEKGKQLLIALLESLINLGGKIGALARSLMERIRRLSEHQVVIYVLKLYHRATYMAGQPGFYSIAALIKLVAFLEPRVRETPEFIRKAGNVIRLLQSKGARGHALTPPLTAEVAAPTPAELAIEAEWHQQ